MLKFDKNSANIASSVHRECQHCKDPCVEEFQDELGNTFCCLGCKMVYHLLEENDLMDFYQLDDSPGRKIQWIQKENYDYLDNPEVEQQLLRFDANELKKVELTLPQIHCSSCLYLLEKLHRFHPGIHSCRINFFQKKAAILFHSGKISLKEVVLLLAKIGYEPQLSFQELSPSSVPAKNNKRLLYKLGIAGFAFGNIMLLSFPEYLGFHNAGYKFYLAYINIFLSLPVVFYCGREYLISAWRGLKSGFLNIDLPIALGILALFGRSILEIATQTGEGYLDSLSGFIFFLLIGKWYQNIAYRNIDFDRNYKSYFPISLQVKSEKDTSFQSKPISQLGIGDEMKIRSGEIIPADGTLLMGEGKIDYSFVTGESEYTPVTMGEPVYAGGRQSGSSIVVRADKAIDQSNLTRLWEEHTFEGEKRMKSSAFLATVSKYFTLAIVIIASLSFLYWLPISSGLAFRVFTTVLIVACPCALALSIPFSFGNILRLFSKLQFFIKNISVVENIQHVDHVVFDKTGTLTDVKTMSASFHGADLDEEKINMIYSICSQSGHPVSRAITRTLEKWHPKMLELGEYTEVISKGIEARIGDQIFKIGSEAFIFDHHSLTETRRRVHVLLNDKHLGYFEITQALRENIEVLIERFRNNGRRTYQVSMLSGDSDKDQELMRQLLGEEANILFNQSPVDKLNYIKRMQEDGQQVMMIGDGLNDAGALRQSDVGIIVSEDQNNFVPACDAIISAHQLPNLGAFISAIQNTRYIVVGLIFLSLCYNFFGLTYAVKGLFTPVIAAILMPLSSLTIVFSGLASTWMLMRFYRFKKENTAVDEDHPSP